MTFWTSFRKLFAVEEPSSHVFADAVREKLPVSKELDMSISVTTRSFSSFRDGANLNETRLTSTYVQANGISHLFDCMLPGDERGSEGMPLIVTGLTMGDGEVHDVLFVASMSNDVRAFDANTPNAETGQAAGPN